MPPIVSLGELAQRLAMARVGRRLVVSLVLVAVFLALIFGVGPSLGLYVNWLWFNSLGYGAVFGTQLSASVTVGLISAAGFFLVALLNLVIALRATSMRRLSVIGVRQRILRTPLGVILLSLMVIVALAFYGAGNASWQTVLLALHAQAFGRADPVNHLDAGFYVFLLPLLDAIVAWVAAIVVVSGLLAAVVYYVRGVTGQRFPAGAVRHAAALLAIIALIIAAGEWLGIYHLLIGSRSVVHGAGFTDVNIRLPAHIAMTALMILAAVLLLANTALRRRWPFVAAVGIWLGGTVVLLGIVPALVQRLEVQPSELSVERPYISNEIQFSRLAYGVNTLQSQAYSPGATVAPADVSANAASLSNVRLWDYSPLLTTYSQIQSFRTYYDFHDVDIDRYTIDGRYRQVMLAARELDTSHLPDAAQTWVNMHLKYTHGYGVVVNAVTDSTQEGLPQLLLKDIPPVGAPPVAQPAIYFGEGTQQYAITGTSESEFDYPGVNDVYTHWRGTAGVPLGSIWRRLAFAINFGDLNLLISSELQATSQVLFHRQITDRAQTLAPFLTFDQDPYIVISAGKLYWIQDAYTTSSGFPYSQDFTDANGDDINYIRNSVKVVTDAYTGQITYYVAAPNDPIIRAYESIFPTLFRPLDTMSVDLRAHIRYPVDMFSLQAQVYALYHMTDPQVFYNREDAWTFPRQVTITGSSQPMQPYYVIMRFPGEAQPEFLLIMPMTPQNKDNMIALLAARNDGAHYGELADLSFPKDELVFGPLQIDGRFDQDPTIKSQLSLLNQTGTTPIRGNLLVIPLDKSILYVEPYYLQAQGGSSLPELRKVLVADNQRVAMADTLGQALAQLLGQAPPISAPSPTPSGGAAPASLAQLIAQANTYYQQALDALKRGDFAGYGQAINALGQVLQQMQQLGSQPVPSPSPSTTPRPSP
jgi:uncharacterized membrane protein (UPF0182 family)